MKPSYFFLAAILISGSAAADVSSCPDETTLSCQSMELRAREHSTQSYFVELKTENKVTTARLELGAYDEKTKTRAYQALAQYSCKSVAAFNPDQPRPILECSDPTTVDSGYRIELSSRDFAGVQWATVTKIEMGGAQEIAKLPCLR